MPAASAGRGTPGSEPRAVVRVPIAVKYGLVTGLLLIIFMAFLGSSAYFLATETAVNEIDDKGIKVALLVGSSIDDPFWVASDRSHEDLAAAQDRLQNKLRAFVDQPGAQGVLDIVVFEGNEENFVASASRSGQLALSVVEEPVVSQAARMSGIEINQGRLGGEPVRSYELPLRFSGAEAGKLRVFLSAAMIEDLRHGLKNSVLGNTLLAVLVGLLVVVMVGSLLTRPIRTLRHDMSVVAMGNLQHVSEVSTGDELEQLAHSFNRMTAHLAEAQEREASRQALERELSIATQIQTSLLPETQPELAGYRLFSYYDSAKEVGGDYYDFIPVDDQRLGLIVADVSGKGIPGSLVMTMTRSLVRMAVRGSESPAEVLCRVNSILSVDMTRGMFVTCMYIDFDPRTGALVVVRAGHNPAFIYRAQTRTLEALQPGGIALGMVGGNIFDAALQQLETELHPGDSLVLYTDGIIEAMDAAGREYTPERFHKVLVNHGTEPVDRIGQAVLDDISAHVGNADPSDDITLVILQREA